MKIGIPKEIHAGEKRVATSPGVAAKLIKLGFSVAVETGAGDAADFPDEVFREVGVEIFPDARSLWEASDIVLKVRAPERNPQLKVDETDLMREGSTLISFLWPAQNPELLRRLAAKKATVLAMDSVPRVSRAQKFDALSSMATVKPNLISCAATPGDVATRFSPGCTSFGIPILTPGPPCRKSPGRPTAPADW